MKILVVDDDPLCRQFLQVPLEAGGHEVLSASNGLEALQLLEQHRVDAVLSDLLMPKMDGFRLCAEIRSHPTFYPLPFVFYSGTYTEPADEQLGCQLGADAFLRKPAPVAVLVETLRSILAGPRPERPASPAAESEAMLEYSHVLVRKLEDRNGRLSARAAALEGSESRLRSIFEAEPDAVLVIDRAGAIVEINRAGLKMFEADSLEQMSHLALIRCVPPEHALPLDDAMASVWRGETCSVEFELSQKHGARLWVEMHAAPLRDARGDITALLGIVRDHTSRKQLEAQFAQAQKMEVVGHLAGGIAHDFNNMLGIIMGYSEIVRGDLTPESSLWEPIETIVQTAERAATLTRQLLIFSRKQTLQPQVLNLNQLVHGLQPMLRRLIGETITLHIAPAPELALVEADPGQIEQILMNLSVNARDALSSGGSISLSTANATFTAETLPLPQMAPGDYVVVAVADDGCGMTPEVKARLFEPFFTTKAAGKGTGLGLATCQSIVAQWRGFITVESAVGCGSVFRVFLPRAAAEDAADQAPAEEEPLPRGEELVLLVEDEAGLRELAATILSRQGYTVLKAANGRDALQTVRLLHGKPIDLVVSDMVMPEMGGEVMAEWLRAADPDLKILLTSGYSDCDLDAALARGFQFLPKPYTPVSLTRKVREVIDGVAPGGQARCAAA